MGLQKILKCYGLLRSNPTRPVEYLLTRFTKLLCSPPAIPTVGSIWIWQIVIWVGLTSFLAEMSPTLGLR